MILDMAVILFIAIASSILSPYAKAQPWKICIEDNGNYTPSSIFQQNLARLPLILPMLTSSSKIKFATLSVGQLPEIVFAMALCRGDTSTTVCQSCITDAIEDAQQLCPYYRDASAFYDSCSVRFSNVDFLRRTSNDNNQVFVWPDLSKSSPVVDVNDACVTMLLNATCSKAASTRSRFATGVFDNGTKINLYGLAQCTPDMTVSECKGCLERLQNQMPLHSGRSSGSIRGIRCLFIYDVSPFFSVPPSVRVLAPPAPTPALAPSLPATPQGHKSNKTLIVIAIVCATLALLFASITMACFLKRRPRIDKARTDSNHEDSPHINISVLREATNNFADRNKLGSGGFGTVYKGILANDQEIAVKRLSESSKQGMKELQNELILVSKLQHNNLVRILGVCLQGNERMIVYEYMPKSSLDTILFDPENCKVLDWGKRMKIINGIIKALQYIHEDSRLKVIHRDLKASNVLLDLDYTPKLADFGLARSLQRHQSLDKTKHIAGTHGYMSPEYVIYGYCSPKQDVYSFGVLVLELVTGKQNNKFHSGSYLDLTSLAWEHFSRATIQDILDPSLSGPPVEEIENCVHIGLLCVQNKPADRPTMTEVSNMLNSKNRPHRDPKKPYCFGLDSGFNSASRPNRTSRAVASLNDVTITEMNPR